MGFPEANAASFGGSELALALRCAEDVAPYKQRAEAPFYGAIYFSLYFLYRVWYNILVTHFHNCNSIGENTLVKGVSLFFPFSDRIVKLCDNNEGTLFQCVPYWDTLFYFERR